MGKKSKKRNRQYNGWDAKGDESTVTIRKVSAKPRSNFKQWLFERKKLLRTVAIVVLVVGIVVFLIVQGISSIH